MKYAIKGLVSIIVLIFVFGVALFFGPPEVGDYAFLTGFTRTRSLAHHHASRALRDGRCNSAKTEAQYNSCWDKEHEREVSLYIREHTSTKVVNK